MDHGEKSDPTSEWRAKVCSDCSSCHRPLAFMEGPVCDRCLDSREDCAGRDKYAQFRLSDAKKLREEMGEVVEWEHDPPSAEESGVRYVARDVLAVDLSCLGRIILWRPSKSTMDTLKDGLRPAKFR